MFLICLHGQDSTDKIIQKTTFWNPFSVADGNLFRYEYSYQTRIIRTTFLLERCSDFCFSRRQSNAAVLPRSVEQNSWKSRTKMKRSSRNPELPVRNFAGGVKTNVLRPLFVFVPFGLRLCGRITVRMSWKIRSGIRRPIRLQSRRFWFWSADGLNRPLAAA